MKRFRQYRLNKRKRDERAETSLNTADLIYPCFFAEGAAAGKNVPGFGPVKRLGMPALLDAAREASNAGMDKMLLFGVARESEKDWSGNAAYSGSGPVEKAVSALKRAVPGMTVITDVCLCGYTSHGHCGVVRKGTVDNDLTLPLLAKMAVSHADAGADIVALSAMMDGQVSAVRRALDAKNHGNTKIMGYSAKYASNFYGPFRNASGSSPVFGDRKTYQIDCRNSREALEEIRADIEEGADIVMVKPAMYYADIISRASTKFRDTPVAAYQVSGEYMMLKHGAKAGLFDEKEAFIEALLAIKRAGAGLIISYYALEAAMEINNRNEAVI